MTDKVYNVDVPAEDKLLRSKMPAFDFSKHSAKEIQELVNRMKRAMHAARGIGLSANQIGLPYAMFVGQVPAQGGDIPRFFL